MTTFIPRLHFPTLDSLPRSYFLGHHAAALTRMKSLISTTDLVIECRDYRLPITSRNPLFEQNLAHKPRLVVYMSKDLARPLKPSLSERRMLKEQDDCIREYNHPSECRFVDASNNQDIHSVLSYLADFALFRDSLAPATCLVVGMPNVGKSTLLNTMRKKGKLGRHKVAKTGGQPGVTRKISSAVKIIEGADEKGSVYVLDTPGVFVPYVPDQDAMLKLALCGNVKDSIIQPTTLADYCLYRINLIDPGLYAEYSEPTNDINEFLEKMGSAVGRKMRGGGIDTEGTAVWMVQRWRMGNLGRFMLDDVSDEGIAASAHREANMLPSMNQAKKAMKESVRQQNKSSDFDLLA